MNRIFHTALVLAIFACASLLFLAPASAQSVYGSIFGTVSDNTGAVIPDATITVTSTTKGTAVTVNSNASGDYSVPHLIPDTYDLRVVAKNFKPFETKGIQVLADTAPRIDPTMTVGSDTGTTVTVSADAAPILKTDKADVSTVFDQQQVSTLPVGDQNFTNLQLLLPGAQILGWSHAADENPQGSQQIQVDGQAFGGTAFELDGTDNQDPILGIIVINPAMDAVTETKITTQNYDAELGKAVSAVVTAQTRSGTNNFHGSAYDFRTGNANLARNPYTQQPGPNAIPPGLKNRFGGSIGGPILKNKAFFFFNWESQRQKVGTSATDSVPTSHLVATCLGSQAPTYGGFPTGYGCDLSEYAAILAGVNSVTGKPNQLIFNNTVDQSAATNNAFANNVIPSSLVSPQSINLLKIMANYAPNTGGTFSPSNNNFIATNFAEGGTGLFNSNSFAERVDWTINEKMHIFERFSRFWDTLSGKVMFGDAGGPGFGIGGYGGNSNGANDSVAVGMDIAINSHLLTDFRLGYYRYNVIDSKYDQGVNFAKDTIGIPGINLGDYFTSGAPGWQIASTGSQNSLIGGGLNINRCNCPLTEREDQYQIVNNWTRIWGNHTVKVGVDLRYARNLRVPSDTDRAGLMTFNAGPTSSNGTLGNGWGTFVLGQPTAYGRYVSESTNAKEFQKRTFFYGQDTWRATKNLTLNLGLRWDLFFPESVNANGNGSLMNLTDGYMHIAGIGGIPTNMGWDIQKSHQFAPRIGVMYQLGEKTVIRAGYGRSFDTGVFGSIFGHVVTQNLPVLANQQLSTGSTTGCVFSTGPGSSPCPAAPLQQGPPAFVFPTTPSNGLLPAQGYAVSPKARHDPLNFPTIDAWNLAIQRAITPTLNLTAAYVGNKGTHTLGDTDQNNTNPNEKALVLPSQYSVTGKTLNWDPNGLSGVLPAGYSGGVSNGDLLRRYYGGSLPACRDAIYATPKSPNIAPGMCGWNQGISYYGDDQNTTFNAMQVTLAKTFEKGFAATANYQWASAYGQQNGYYTWDVGHHITHLRDSNVRRQQLVTYGSYDLPFGRGKQYASNVNHAMDLLIGQFQLSYTLNWASGLPFSVGYDQFAPGSKTNVQDCNASTGGTDAPCRPNNTGHMKTSLGGFNTTSHTRNFFNAQPRQGGIFQWPGLDNIGNTGANTYFGPSYFNTDLAIVKGFTIWESVVAKFRMDAYNAFNHINPANPGNTDVFGSVGTATGAPLNNINNVGPGQFPTRQLVFSARIQF
jgi:hypothetical protein